MDGLQMSVSLADAQKPVDLAAAFLEFERPIDVEAARAALKAAPGVTLVDDPHSGVYPTPRDADGADDVLGGSNGVDDDFALGNLDRKDQAGCRFDISPA